MDSLCMLDAVYPAFTNRSPRKAFLNSSTRCGCIHIALMAFIADLCHYKDSLGIYF